MTKADLFKVRLGRWENATKAKLDALARQVCFEMAQRVVEKTPVDTGFLRGSWQPSIGAPQVATDPAPDPAGAAASATIAAVIPQIKAGDRFYMLNNASYARAVEYGTSKMAGRHYVSDTVAAWPEIVRSTAAELGLKKK